jgi:N-methylhydantoinase A/oxoprolinase/acetone carboxylase beta subunit
VFVDGRWQEIPVLFRDSAGSRWGEGPALILDPGATALVPPGWAFRRDTAGAIVIHWKR